MHQANVNAKKLILSEYGTGSRAQKADTVLDLHFLYVQEALSALQGFLQVRKLQTLACRTRTKNELFCQCLRDGKSAFGLVIPGQSF